MLIVSLQFIHSCGFIVLHCVNISKLFLFFLLLMSSWVVSSLETLHTALPDTILCMSFGDHLRTSLLGTYLGMKLLGHRTGI